ncbi:hypothetical protein Lal_00044186 [Lupinus albus]|nr:hypothetical protein Lal_00044186 [Lupinus albus]
MISFLIYTHQSIHHKALIKEKPLHLDIVSVENLVFLLKIVINCRWPCGARSQVTRHRAGISKLKTHKWKNKFRCDQGLVIIAKRHHYNTRSQSRTMADQETPTNLEGKSEMTELKEQMAEMMKMMMKMQQENTTGNFSKTNPGANTTPPPRQGSSSKQTTKEGKGKGSETKEQQHDGQNENTSQTEETDDENTEQPTDETNPNDDMNYRPPKDDKQPTGPQTGKEIHERILAPIAGQTPNTTAPWYDPNANCDYHSGIIGHSTETCRALKHRIQDLIDSKWLEFKDTIPTITGNPLPNHGNQGINVLEQDDDMVVVEKVEDMKTPLKVIFKVWWKWWRGAYEDDVCLMHGILDHTLEICTEFKALVQRLLDSRLLRPEDPRQNNHEEVCASTEHTRWNPIIYRFPRWVPRLYIESGATRHPGPFPYKSDKAIPWKYQGKSMAKSKQTEEFVNLAGVGNMTRSGRVYSPVDLSKKIINASKGKEKIPEPEVTELFPEKMEREVSEEEACEFLRFIKQSEYQVIDQLSRTPAKVSLLSLLMNSEAHKEVLFKVLNRAHERIPTWKGFGEVWTRDGEHISPPVQYNCREGASEDKKSKLHKYMLQQARYYRHGRRWSMESDLGLVYQCISGTGLSNWTEEDVASDVYYAISDNESITNENFNNHLPNLDHPINQAEEDNDEEWERPRIAKTSRARKQRDPAP